MKAQQYRNIDDYVSNFPLDVQEVLEQIRMTIQLAVPAAEETMKYNMPAFSLNDKLVYFAAFKNHIGFYPAPTDVQEFKDDLVKYKAGKGSLQFPLKQPIPYPLINRLAKHRLKRP